MDGNLVDVTERLGDQLGDIQRVLDGDKATGYPGVVSELRSIRSDLDVLLSRRRSWQQRGILLVVAVPLFLIFMMLVISDFRHQFGVSAGTAVGLGGVMIFGAVVLVSLVVAGDL